MKTNGTGQSNLDEVVGLIQVDSFHEDQPIRNREYTKANQDSAGSFRMLALLNSTGIMALAPHSIPNPGLPDDAYTQYQASLATTGFFKTTIAELNAQAGHCVEVRPEDYRFRGYAAYRA